MSRYCSTPRIFAVKRTDSTMRWEVVEVNGAALAVVTAEFRLI
jgi:hypothetical protein